jgi:hypothetical protein
MSFQSNFVIQKRVGSRAAVHFFGGFHDTDIFVGYISPNQRCATIINHGYGERPTSAGAGQLPAMKSFRSGTENDQGTGKTRDSLTLAVIGNGTAKGIGTRDSDGQKNIVRTY